MPRGHNVEEAPTAVKLTESQMSDLDRTRKWKTHYWATQRVYAQGQLDYLRKGQFQLTGKDGRDHLGGATGATPLSMRLFNDTSVSSRGSGRRRPLKISWRRQRPSLQLWLRRI